MSYADRAPSATKVNVGRNEVSPSAWSRETTAETSAGGDAVSRWPFARAASLGDLHVLRESRTARWGHCSCGLRSRDAPPEQLVRRVVAKRTLQLFIEVPLIARSPTRFPLLRSSGPPCARLSSIPFLTSQDFSGRLPRVRSLPTTWAFGPVTADLRFASGGCIGFKQVRHVASGSVVQSGSAPRRQRIIREAQDRRGLAPATYGTWAPSSRHRTDV